MCKEKIKIIKRDEYFNILNKIKSIKYFMYKEKLVVSVEQAANYYEVSNEAIKTVVKRHRDELETDGIQVLKGEDLKDLKNENPLVKSKITILTILSLKSTILIGFYLNSKIANKIKQCTSKTDMDLFNEFYDKTHTFDYIKRYENSFGDVTKLLLGKYNKIDEQVCCGKYRIDFVINNKIAIEVDEYGHNHYDKNEEQIREEYIKSHNYILYRFNPMKDDVLEFMGEIIQEIKFNKAIEE